MKGITKTTHVNSAMQVIQHMNDGMTVVDTCREVGLARNPLPRYSQKQPAW